MRDNPQLLRDRNTADTNFYTYRINFVAVNSYLVIIHLQKTQNSQIKINR